MNLISEIKRTNASLERWLKARPVLVACIATGLTAAIVVELVVVDVMFHALGEPLDLTLIACHGAVIFGIGSIWCGVDKLNKGVGVALVASLLLAGTTPTRAEPPPKEAAWALCIGVVVVVVIGALVIVKAKRVGDRIGKARTNAWPDEVIAPSQSGAAFSWSDPSYCTSDLQAGTPVNFTMRIKVQSPDKATTTMRADVGPEYVQTVEEFREELAGIGLKLAASPGQTESYALNRQPAKPDEVPIRFDWASQTATVGAGTVVVAVDASNNLTTWHPLLRIKVVPGAIVEVSDATESGASFYRVSLSQ